ncbi:MAG: bifunctional phosphoribosyl-AMP cyclohydrolase/phosphoribosyl-ATP diphosphatase HisIE [Clostridiales bacterium]|jgi:phosphoribosyl-ATP pyrophosphohydrolase/phosphoribosyl-AMP cyclohydrolase|nr:bifunctional phosphoribosyl-AMP cyclohydrolase/phosphoribosyl-ATP diphosphatase HisIE [Clostridiales bacterium]HOC08800.1 bifunctional phosphoribosyl-AMP cyclohydrolase/phosphoribosyl-ATP diphosphatase HisIE [Bacillota bacterium]HQA47460.1 bifunctional phosphoribosyl-AMP cyclohydrolase/phosphoribosyl-ATP diphosphatase HisIE [Bacillota bacterium]
MTQRVIDGLKFDDRGLIPAIVQDRSTGRVLMMAYMNKEALEKTVETGTTWFFSRSRNKLWNKGETSGNVQRVTGICVDCDMDTLLLLVDQQGAACHTGNRSCFYRDLDGSPCDNWPETAGVLDRLYSVVLDRRNNPREGSYTNYLLEKGLDKTLKKVGEEAAEVIIGAKNPGKQETVYEIADLLYHITVLMLQKGIEYHEVYSELASRHVKDR